MGIGIFVVFISIWFFLWFGYDALKARSGLLCALIYGLVGGASLAIPFLFVSATLNFLGILNLFEFNLGEAFPRLLAEGIGFGSGLFATVSLYQRIFETSVEEGEVIVFLKHP